MLRMLSTFTFVLAVVLGAHGFPEEDLVVDLPGASFEIPFKQYSGYLSPDTSKHLHYWFVESERNPSEDPIIVWMNGGPGCSSLDGFLTELGPFKVNDDGQTLMYNPYAWNKNASVIFLETPICTGFSYSDGEDCVVSDDSGALDNYMALRIFFESKFPEYLSNELYLTGESYAGIYVPLLAQLILDETTGTKLNLKGFAVGNGVSNMETSDNSLMFYAKYHALLDEDIWSSLVTECCEGGESRHNCDFHIMTDNPTVTEECMMALLVAYDEVWGGGLNPYSIYGECVHVENSTHSGLSRLAADMHNNFRHSKQPRFEPDCTDSSKLRSWINSPEVRSALHIPEYVQNWDICSQDSNDQYVRQYGDMTEQYQNLLPHVRALVYNGDWDTVCNYLGTQWFVESLGLE
ncbi:unnamed protein product, partial [Meganyctiphanes norvegica]